VGLLLVGYDLTRPDQDDRALAERLRSFGWWWHGLGSTWIVRTDLTTVQLRDDLRSYVDPADKLLVLDVTGDAGAWSGMSKSESNWLLEQLANGEPAR
jgi:hypothetical protein